ncbi:MerR family transcriptional regulator [Amycolatopsis sp. CA-230715]|uniref:MerR family transcriptional regulator n=1 Tax=Amycolatopsis sp. CA-230715 TaxID=2745196 RepID=UPI001C02B226|nr:MerR family transcriptional regulator [Amycolatopsis sp. CA-230715]QWF78075.1 Mercuric resistance operon regulatory protein [Amycolatopsis sp. CA-230715]
MLIGELAKRTGTTTRTLRFYGEQGLLDAGRTAAGYRVYEPAAERRVRNIRELLAAGFTVENVRAFLPVLDRDLPAVFSYTSQCASKFAIAEERIGELRERIATLTRLHDRLVDMVPWLGEPVQDKALT